MYDIKPVLPLSTWTIRAWHTNGQAIFLTGFDNGIIFNWTFDIPENQVELVHNFTFSAVIALEGLSKGSSSHTFVFSDVEDSQIYQTGAMGMAQIIYALGHNYLYAFNIDNKSCISGKWTFKKQGTAVYLYPVIKEPFENQTLYYIYKENVVF